VRLFAQRALLPDGWAENVGVDVGDDGTIAQVTRAEAAPGAAAGTVATLLPGMPNLHSHAFQRAMAGRAEQRGAGRDDFWSWREAMYALATTLDPAQLYAIARDAYGAMLRAGYTAVAEFHYLHRDPSGCWYGDRAAMAHALIRAARDAGIAICLLPALYAHAAPGGAPLGARQKRFATTPDEVLSIAEALRSAYRDDAGVVVGACAHSLRAVTPDELHALVDGSPAGVPIHLHIAEQQREVDEVVATLGAPPVTWLFEHAAVDERWCLVHATQTSPEERAAIARSGAVAGLCPTTEANLGDGIFGLADYVERGAYGVGSDSNVALSPVDELRLLEYGQRLALRRRIVAGTRGRSCGETLYADCAAGGARACGFRAGAIAPGYRADFVALDGAPDAERLDRYVFAESNPVPARIMTGGVWRSDDGV
jgi:formimidoylglutamate deiminase